MRRSGYNINGNISLFHGENGGSSPTYPLNYRISKCEFYDISEIFKKYHYKGSHIGGGISFCLALTDVNQRVVGGAVIGKPRHEKVYTDAVEIRRMACLDECPKNTESFFLSKILWYVKKKTEYKSVLSYADTSVGHTGTIYKAANFKLVGQTSESKHVFWNGVRYHPRSLSINRPYADRLREAIKTGEAYIVTGTPKNIFLYEF